LCWDEDSSLLNTLYPTTRDMMSDSRFLAGFAEIDRLGLSFEAWAFFPQLGDVARLARTFPNTQIVVNHCGGLLRVHRYANQSDLYACWAVGISELAQCPNVTIKLSGLGMRISAFAFGEAPAAPSSECLAEAWRPWIDHCLAEFGPARCMWGSNFPVDKGSYSFGNGLNAMKRLTAGYGPSEKNDIFWRTAAQVYRLGRQIAL
jgi:predicted TIM-barrel fold metal-dependent hydrolase